MATATAPVARSPLHHWHATHSGRFVSQAGWQVVEAYSTADREASAARAGVGVIDVSDMTKISLRGSGVGSVLQALGIPLGKPMDAAVVSIGGPVLACRQTLDQVLLASLGDAAGLLQVPASLPPEIPVVAADVTSGLAGFCLAGSNTDALLRHLTPIDICPAALPVNRCAETSLAGVEALLVRVADLAIPSARIFVAWDLAEYVWARILEAGKRHGATPAGKEALKLLA